MALSWPSLATDNKDDTICEKSPKAKPEIYVGNHVENLAAKEPVSISPTGEIDTLNNLPIWFSHSPSSNSPDIYSELFWEREPMGEYLYFLAGNYKKNEKGLLRYGTPTTMAKVEVNFEDDVLRVAKATSKREQELAEQQSDPELIRFLRTLTIQQLTDKVSKSEDKWNDRVSFISLNSIVPDNESKLTRLVISKPYSGAKPFVTLLHQEFFKPEVDSQYPRYLKIKVESNEQDVSIDNLINQFEYLIQRYSQMPYRCLSGTTRG